MKLGILGGGQLARMMVPPAHRLGVEVWVLERQAGSPAALAGAREVVGDWNDPAILIRFADGLDAITLDHEFVDANALQRLVDAGAACRPGPETLARIQDKLVQKETLRRAGLPVSEFRPVGTPEELRAAASTFGLPLMLKARRNGYDGRGNRTIRSEAELDDAWAEFAGGPGGVYVEAWVPFRRELAVMVVRDLAGHAVCYPVVETIQRNHICHRVEFPADLPPATDARAREIAIGAAESVGVVGALGVELFEADSGRILVNELAPRPHNSGHYTIEACRTSQFENHVRAVLGWPTGDPSPVVPAAVMVNLLAGGSGEGRPEGIAEALAQPAALHLYAKSRSVPGRKMGHVTATAATISEARVIAERAANALRFGREV